MSQDILSIEQLREMAFTVIEIPNFDNTGTIKVKVQRPRLLTMAKEGKIPNHLLGIANQMLMGRKNSKKLSEKQQLKQVSEMMELYTRACLVEPTYEEFKDIMTDDQGNAIFEFAMGEIKGLDSFRKDEQDDTGNTDGKKVSAKA